MTKEDSVPSKFVQRRNCEPSEVTEGRSIAKVVRARTQRGGAGVDLKAALGSPELEHLDPFLRLAHFGGSDPKNYVAGFPDHPHRGFETITYMIEGRMIHCDSRGNRGVLDPGGAQRMTAGRGIVHSEMPIQESGGVSGFQLWVNLPANEKMCTPRYQDASPQQVPRIRHSSGASIKVLCGTYCEATGPLSGGTTEPALLDITLPVGTGISFDIPARKTAFAYVFEGSVSFGGERHSVSADHLVVFRDDGARIGAYADTQSTRFLLVSGNSLNEPIVHYGPFVVNDMDEVRQAIEDYQRGRF